MAVPANVVFIWTGTHAAIPAGWTRDTDFDEKYVVGADTGNDGGTTGGSATHTHTSPAHTHTQNSHTHPVSLTTPATAAIPYSLGGITQIASAFHSHSGTSASVTAVNQNATVTVNTASNDPPYYEVIFLKSNGTNDIADDMIGIWDTATPPANWQECNGTSSSPDLRGKFLQGAAAAGDAGGTGGSSDSHTHTTVAHNHTQNSHTHGSATSNTGSGSVLRSTAIGLPNTNRLSHTHTFSLAAATATNQTATPTMSSDDGQPKFKMYLFIQNQTGGDDLPDGIIGMWKSTAASIPANWSRFAALDDYFVYGNSASIGDTGGSKTHGHTGVAHTHTQISHTHTIGKQGAASTSTYLQSGFFSLAHPTYKHTHSSNLVTGTVATNQNTNITVNDCTSEAAYPPYIEVIFIEHTKSSIKPQRALRGVGI